MVKLLPRRMEGMVRLQGQPHVAECVLEGAHGHVGEFADRIVDDLVARVLEFLARHAENWLALSVANSELEMEIDQPVDVADEADRADHLLAFDFDGASRGVGCFSLAVKDGILIEHRLHDVLNGASDGLPKYHLADSIDRWHDSKGKRQRTCYHREGIIGRLTAGIWQKELPLGEIRKAQIKPPHRGRCAAYWSLFEAEEQPGYCD